MPSTHPLPSTPMTSAKGTPLASAEHHTKAAECCTKAAAEHMSAAKACSAGDKAKAEDHAKKAECHCTEAKHQSQGRVEDSYR